MENRKVLNTPSLRLSEALTMRQNRLLLKLPQIPSASESTHFLFQQEYFVSFFKV